MPNPPVRLSYPVVAAVLALAALVLGLHLEFTVRRTDRALVTFDSAEYAIAGREWARSGRLGTTFVLPHESLRPARPPFPLILGHPLVPAFDALAFRIGGTGGAATLVPPALAYAALVALVLALARALGASAGGAVTAAAAVAIAPRVLTYASEGLTEIPFAALLVAIVLVLARDRPPRPLVLGLLLGLAHLTRPVMVPLLPVALAGLAARLAPGARGRGVGVALVSFLTFAGALALYKAVTTGDPFADVSHYNLLIGLAPGFTPVGVQCMVDPPAPIPVMLSSLDALGRKLGSALPDLTLGLFAQAGPLGTIAAAGLGVALARRRERVPAAVILGFGALMVGVAALSLPSRRYLVPLLPLLLTVAVVALERTGRALRLPGVACIALPALVTALTLGRATARDWRWAIERGVRDRGVFTESEWRHAGDRIASLLPPATLMASDAGAFVAWYADRPAVQVPGRVSDLPALGQRLEIGALVLTNEWLLDQPGFETWRGVAERPGSLAGWRHTATVRSGRLRAVILTPDGAPPAPP